MYGVYGRIGNRQAGSGYQCQTLALGVNTDAYQPVERKLEITRSVLQVLQRFALACKKLGLEAREYSNNCAAFKVPARSGDQRGLF